jgi:hypothetical protein
MAKKILKKAVIEQSLLESLLPKWLLYTGIIIAGWYAILNYYNVYPLMFEKRIFVFFHFYSDKTFSTIALSNWYFLLKNIFLYLSLTVIFFVSAKGFGSILRKQVFKFFSPFEVFVDIALGLALIILYSFVLSSFSAFNTFYIYVYVVIGFLYAIYDIYKNYKQKLEIKSCEDKNLTNVMFYSATILLGITALFNLLNASTPEIFFDSMKYHLALPQLWINKSQIYFPYSLTMSFTPLNMEVLYSLGMLLKNDILSKYFHFGFGVIIIYLIYVMGKQFFSKATGILASLIFYTTPMVMVVVYKTALEVGLGFFELLSFALFISWFKEIDPQNKKKNIILSGICMGLALGPKYTAIFGFIGIIIVFLYIYFSEGRKKENISYAFYFIIFAGIVSAPWYIKNYLYTGNPLFPMYSNTIGYVKLKMWDNLKSDPVSVPFTISNYLFFPWKLAFAKISQESLTGIAYVLLIPLVFLFKNRNNLLKLILIYVLVCVFFWATRGKFYFRYFIPTLPLVALLLSAYLMTNDWNKIIKKIIFYTLLMTGFTNLIFAMHIIGSSNLTMDYLFGFMNKAEYMSLQRPTYPNPYYKASEWINKNVPKDKKVLSIGDARCYLFEREMIFQDICIKSPLVEYLAQVKNEDELYALFKQKNISHIFINVLEAQRLSGFDSYDLNAKQCIIFDKFIRKYTGEVFKDLTNSILNNGKLLSEVPNFLAVYKQNFMNYTYVYEIKNNNDILPIVNFLIFPSLYSSSSWKKLIEDPQFVAYLKTEYKEYFEAGLFNKK